MPTVSEGWDWGLSVHLRPTTFACSSIQLNLNLKRLGNSDTDIDIKHSPSVSQALPLLQPPLNPVSTAEESSPTPHPLCQPVSIYMQLSAKQLPYFFFLLKKQEVFHSGVLLASVDTSSHNLPGFIAKPAQRGSHLSHSHNPFMLPSKSTSRRHGPAEVDLKEGCLAPSRSSSP